MSSRSLLQRSAMIYVPHGGCLCSFDNGGIRFFAAKTTIFAAENVFTFVYTVSQTLQILDKLPKCR